MVADGIDNASPTKPIGGTPFKAVPMAALPKEALADTPPKRRGRPPRDPNAPRATRRSKSLETQIGSALMTLNLAFWAVPPLRNDALDDAEIVALAKAIDQQARVSPRFRKYLTAALEATSGGQLMSVVVIIGARRLARHNIALPNEADAALGKMLANITSAPVVVPVPNDDDVTTDDAARE
jgi:hypothetical protein